MGQASATTAAMPLGVLSHILLRVYVDSHVSLEAGDNASFLRHGCGIGGCTASLGDGTSAAARLSVVCCTGIAGYSCGCLYAVCSAASSPPRGIVSGTSSTQELSSFGLWVMPAVQALCLPSDFISARQALWLSFGFVCWCL